jgi:outer membrane PBP1 activator LpoA protein
MFYASRPLRSTHPALLLGLALLLASCKSLGPESAPPPSVDRAEILANHGDNAGAARVYESLAAENTGQDRADLLLRAARAWLLARQADEATRVLGTLESPLTQAQEFERQMLGVELALARGQAPQAWQQLSTIPEPASPPAAPRYFDLKRRVAFATGRAVEAVRAEIAAERWQSAAERHASRATLLAELRDASERGTHIDLRYATDPVTRGWLELAPLAAEAARNPTTASAGIEAWRVHYPGHPAEEVVGSELLGASPVAAAPAPNIALLLPLTGRQATASATVRDGFLTGLYVAPAAQRPRVRIYDTGSVSVSEAVGRATQEGAEFIVGPLTREEVQAAADLTLKHPPVLALNFLAADRAAPAGFYQFALSPEDEARQAARRILMDGYRQGVALVPSGDWGSRVLTAFKDELTAGGGTLADTVTFDAAHPEHGDYAQAVTQVLRIGESNARLKRLESVLGTKLEFQPRRRSDIAFIFAASQVATARVLRPLLKFYFAGDVPTYATSDAFEPNPNANQDMDGLIFPDMPWMLGGALADSVRTAANDAWPSSGPRRNRLFAFGFDAYRLATALRAAPSGAPVAVDGLTGRLSLDAERRVHRELDWAQLHDGQPRVLARVAE